MCENSLVQSAFQKLYFSCELSAQDEGIACVKAFNLTDVVTIPSGLSGVLHYEPVDSLEVALSHKWNWTRLNYISYTCIYNIFLSIWSLAKGY